MHKIFYKIKKVFSEDNKKILRKIRNFLFYTLDKNKPYLNKIKYFGFLVFYTKDAMGSGLINRIRFGNTEKIYETELSKEIIQRISEIKNPKILDIGSNIGLISLYLLSQKKDLKIYAFEPSPIPFKNLFTTIFANKLENRLVLENVAISDNNDDATFVIHGDDGSSGDGLIETNRSLVVGEKISVQTKKIDDWWEKNEKPKIDLIKIDIEGAELLALRGSRELLKNCRPLVFVEICKKNLENYPFNEKDIVDFVHEINYKIKTISDKECTKENISELMESEDTFVLSPQ